MSNAAEFLPDSRALKTLEQAADRGRPLKSLASFVADLDAVATALPGAAK